MDDAQRAREAAGEYVAGFRWQAYAVLTFSARPSAEGVQKAVARWFHALRGIYPRVFLHYNADRGAATDHWNVHVLLGGIFPQQPPREPYRALAIRRAIGDAAHAWQHGRVEKAEPYDPRRGAPRYLAQYWNDTEIPATTLGPPLRKSH
jgi:hypothetical protein